MRAERDAEVDRILHASADSTRRRILEQLILEPGATTTRLAERSPEITRWAVMKHLVVLREAGLIQTLPEGRMRRHFRVKGALRPLSEWLRNTELG